MFISLLMQTSPMDWACVRLGFCAVGLARGRACQGHPATLHFVSLPKKNGGWKGVDDESVPTHLSQLDLPFPFLFAPQLFQRQVPVESFGGKSGIFFSAFLPGGLALVNRSLGTRAGFKHRDG